LEGSRAPKSGEESGLAEEGKPRRAGGVMGIDVFDDTGKLVIDLGVGAGTGTEPAEGRLGAVEVAVFDEPARATEIRG
jgi:hypothetical protein